MLNTKKIIITLVFLSILFSLNTYAYGEVNISPIVQVISYTDIYGKYPQMMGWGSASIINKNGIIISNDHVVDSGNGALSSAFSVCITKEISKKPVCDYTASLIARDDKLDISILKIDEKDIHGNKVDYTKFKTIDIDYNYEPKNQDDVIAIGYPWIGADTISETKGIVSGISEYNGYSYIKTDTLIAGGNSGGAFIKDGKLIGIPTFGIGWGDSMGYALSIKEAKDFIEENISKEAKKSSITSLIDFNSYRKTIEDINNSLKLQDDVFDLSLGEDYQVSNYIKNVYLNIELKKQKDTGVSYFGVYLEKAPKIENDKQKLYYFQLKGLYSKDWQKLIKKNINGIEYYYSVDKSDLSDGNSSWGNTYFTIENGYLITIYIQAPFYDEKRNKEIKTEVEKLLNSLKINKNNFSKIQTSFSTNIPKIDIKTIKDAIVDTGKYKFYLGNLYENFEIYLNELVEYNGKGKTAQEIYDVQLKDVDDSLKSMISFNGLDGFINCGNQSYGSYYNYYNYYGSYAPYIDENGNSINLETCEINLFFPINKELNRQNYLSLKLTSLANNKQKNLDIAIEFLKRFLKVDGTSTEVNIPNILKSQVKLNFTDLKNQTKEYKNFLNLLVRYNMIENSSKFDGDTPIAWGEFLDMYMKYVYNYKIDSDTCGKNDYRCKFEFKVGDKSLDSIFNELGITDYNEYINSSKIYNFDTILNYKLAGVEIGSGYTMENFLTFQNLINEEQLVGEKNKLNNFNNSIYGNRKILIYDFYSNYNTYYFSTKYPLYYPEIGKIVYINDNLSKIDFSSKRSQFDIELDKLYKSSKCYLKPTYNESLKCEKDYDKKYKEIQEKYLDNKDLIGLDGEYSFYPLTKSQAIEKIFSQVDFGLFDTKLAKKKDTTIDGNNIDENKTY
ncbi:MAG: serine protease [Candidatus Gracilibacteria bacterium]|nr:serine protease [Candidatus Gracilibacteria bacterium]